MNLQKEVYTNAKYRALTYSSTYEARALTSGVTRNSVTLQDLIDHLGTNIWLQMGGADSVPTQELGNKRVVIELTAAGLEKAIIVIFDIPHPKPSILPWD